jgi:putative ABC transport system ATP-binding protein
LDVDTELEILQLLRSINAEGMTVILVTHNPNLTDFGNRHLRMDRGRLIEARNSSPSNESL